jgi:uncharacterized protein YigE (DUF2233 family)
LYLGTSFEVGSERSKSNPTSKDEPMNRAVIWCALFFIATAAFADWERVTDGLAYQRFNKGGIDVHVARVDLENPAVKVVSTRESERGLRVGDYAKKNKALIAINADYFTKELKPIGLAIGPCGTWADTKDTEREGVIAVGDGRAAIYPQREVLPEPEPWMTTAVSGWPMLVRECKALTASELPGSDGFTRAPHPRTAMGTTSDGKTLYLVVADGRREGVPGFTLARLAAFMKDELGVCSAMNLDGGGSSAMWLRDGIVNRPSDGSERRVANHVAVIAAADYTGCDPNEKAATIDAAAIEDTKKREEAEQKNSPAPVPAKPPATQPTTPPPAPPSLESPLHRAPVR